MFVPIVLLLYLAALATNSINIYLVITNYQNILSFNYKHHIVEKIQITDVKITAPIVPTGIDFWGSERSPDLFEPDMKPNTTGRQYCCNDMKKPA